MKETGALLKKAREEKGISLEELSQKTKIKVATLVALEKGDTSLLPQKAFIRGFVRAYAICLQMNVNDVMDLFHKEMGQTGSGQSLQSNDNLTNDPAVQIANSQRNPFIKSLIAIAIIVLCGTVFATYKIFEKYQSESVTEPIENLKPIKKISESERVSAEARQGEEEIKAAENTSLNTNVSETSPEQASAEPSSEQEAPTPTTPAPTPTPTPASTPTPNPEPTPDSTPKPLARYSQRIILEALDQTKVLIVIDDGKSKTIDMRPGQILNIKAKESMQIQANDGGALNIIHNGKDLGVIGTLGEKLNKNFP